ncbi:MAG: peroxide stress protein YaaA, partial [Verrucomicrobiota bacterium]
AVPTGAFEGRVISPVFKDWKKGKLKIISFFAKKARGTMADFLIRERIKKPDDLKGFTGMGYAFDAEGSSGDEWLFTREEGEAA